ncbi:hypothetical protein AVEN_243340-2 [Araneus ventricosus]|nr:hypothetical protein AVEN_243340-2 [Araneus ventricosus]
MLSRPEPLSRLFTSLSKWNFWNTGRKKQSSVLKNDGNWHSEMAKLEFQRTQSPILHALIPIWGLDARVAEHQRICLDWEKSEIRRVELEKWGGGERRAVVEHLGASDKWVEKKNSFGTNGIQMNAQL